MNINERQFQYLQTMGVSLWQSRPQFFQANLSSDLATKDSIAPKSITNTEASTDTKNVIEECKTMHGFDSIEQFFAHPLSTDILIALNCEKSKVSLSTAGVQLDTLLWQFNSDDKCSYQEQILTTPSLKKLAKDKRLKSELWACLCNHINN